MLNENNRSSIVCMTLGAMYATLLIKSAFCKRAQLPIHKNPHGGRWTAPRAINKHLDMHFIEREALAKFTLWMLHKLAGKNVSGALFVNELPARRIHSFIVARESRLQNSHSRAAIFGVHLRYCCRPPRLLLCGVRVVCAFKLSFAFTRRGGTSSRLLKVANLQLNLICKRIFCGAPRANAFLAGWA
jgi:hypothetical protein